MSVEPVRRRVVGITATVVALKLFSANPAHAQEPSPEAQPPSVEAQAPAPEAQTTLRGVVTDERTGAPYPGAGVSIPATGVLVFTDERGEYTIPVSPGTHVVRVEAQGLFPLEKSVTVATGPTVLDFAMAEDRLGEVITIVGSRTPRSRLETSAPVDIITSDVITEASQSETNQILNVIAPSFNANHGSVADGTDHIDPADLRGLGPEHVLVLVNGKRLHQSSLINVYSGGTVGVDLNAIPTSAIARIEVLRDGAASQYGSDAIAGVINIVLKEDVDLFDIYTMTGLTASNDGAQFKLGANTGFKLGKRGFVNITGEVFSRGRSNRAKDWPGDIFPGITGKADTDAELKRRGLTRADFNMGVGQAGADVGTSFLNAGYKLDNTFSLYAHGGYTIRQGYASGYFRFPTDEKQVDLSVYPNGFLPEINPRLNAWTGTVGARAKKGAVEGDLSLSHGGDNFKFFIENSINASLGAMSPTSFDAGKLNYGQTSLNLDGVWRVDQRAVKSLNVVAGAELRRETYSIDAGEPASYELGPVTTEAGEPKLPGAQVFPGFRPSDASNNSRLSESVYAGVESQPTARTNVDLGGRFEHYSDFGSTITWKAAGRLALLKTEDNEIALRGSVSTGFRAPGLQQVWYSTIATQFVNDPDTNLPTATNILISPNRSAVTEAFGVPRLKEETSLNFSGGFTARLLGNLSLSTDYYRVVMKDRVVLSGLFGGGPEGIGVPISTILEPFPGVAAAQFFVNAVDTTTNGVDVVLDYSFRLPKGTLKATAAANFTKTTVDAVNVPESMQQRFSDVEGGEEQVAEVFLGRYGRNRLEDLLPRQKGTLGLRWDSNTWSVGARANAFGPTEYHSDTDGLDESYDARLIFDVDVGYRVGSLWWSVGANNVFNTFPDEQKHEGNRYFDSFLYSPASVPAGAPYGTDGAFYYVRVEYKL